MHHTPPINTSGHECLQYLPFPYSYLIQQPWQKWCRRICNPWNLNRTHLFHHQDILNIGIQLLGLCIRNLGRRKSRHGCSGITEPQVENILILKQGRMEDWSTRVNGIPATGMTRCTVSRKDLLPRLVLFEPANGPPSISQFPAKIPQHRYGAKAEKIDRKDFHGRRSIFAPQEDG